MEAASSLILETLYGPDSPRLVLTGTGPYTIGRNKDNDMPLIAGATVSRKHAVLTKSESGQETFWKLYDMGSLHGTYLNGIKMEKGKGVHLHVGDLVAIEPYTFQVTDPDDEGRFTQTFDDVETINTDSIQRIDQVSGGVGLGQDRLAAMLECSVAIHAAENETKMAEALATAACAGTAFSNVAVVKPAGGGRVEILATKGRITNHGALSLSRSLLDAAMEGEPVRFRKENITEEQAQSIMQYSIQEALCVPIKIENSVSGCIYLDNRDGQVRGFTVDDDIEFCSLLAEIASLASLNLMRIDLERRYAQERHGLLLGTVSALVSAIDAKDTYTRGHSERVAWLAKELGKVIALDFDTLEQLHICGLVHDIGKIGIPESILRKSSRLTDEEFDQIREHAVIGEKILKDVPQLQTALPGVRSHHERWDGGGYPDGLKGNDIPLFGRILGVADSFDAMCSSRAYRKALDREEVLQEITACSSSQFDPALAEAFLGIDFANYDDMIGRHTSQDSMEI